MRPRWRNAFQPRPNRPLRAPTKGAMNSTGARPRPLRSLLLLTLLTASLAICLKIASPTSQRRATTAAPRPWRSTSPAAWST
jgi:hypothetical protein